MKFFVTKEIRENRPLVGMLIGMNLMILIYLAANAWMLGESVGISAASVVASVLGDGEFGEPMELGTMVESVHSALFIGAIGIMITLSLLLRLSRNDRFNLLMTIGIFASFIGMHGTLFLIRFVSPGWVDAYLGSFYLYHLMMGSVTVFNLYRLSVGEKRHGS